MTTQVNIVVGQSIVFKQKDSLVSGTGVVLEMENDWLLLGTYITGEGYCTILVNMNEVIYN